MPLLFTTSWDDGYALDLRVAELLDRHGLRGTFYVCPQAQHGHEMLTEQQVRELSQRHEIGAHTLTHCPLTDVDQDTATQEIRGSKEWVERVTGQPCASFCYPWGKHNTNIREIVQAAGFSTARTVDALAFDHTDPLAMPTTIHVYPFPWRPRWKRWWHPLDPAGPLRAKWSRLRSLQTPLRACRSWNALAEHLLDHAIAKEQPVFHLWGHSHEIERYDMWDDLDRFFQYVAKKGGVQPVTNAELIQST